MRIRDGDSKTGTASDDFPYYEIPGQMSIEDFIKADESKRRVLSQPPNRQLDYIIIRYEFE